MKKTASMIGVVGLSMTTLVGITACGNGSSSSSSQSGNASSTASSSSGGNASSNKPVTLNIYVGYYTSNPKAQADLYNNTLIPAFEKANPGVTVKWSYYSSSSQENTQLQTAVATHQGPDVFELGTTFVPTAYATNAFHVLSAQDWATAGGQSRLFAPQLTMSGPSPDKYIAVPEYMLPFAMLYNTKMFKAAGISSPPTTWNEFISDAQKLTKPAQKQWGTVIDPADSYDPWKVVWSMAKQQGGGFISSDLKTATLDQKPAVNALQFYFDWLTKYHIVSPNDLTYKNADAAQQFMNGHIAMWLYQGPTLLPSLEKSAVKNDFAFAPMPTVPYGMTSMPSNGVAAQTIVSGQELAIPKYVTGAKYQDALKWIKFVTDSTQQQEFFKTFGYLPVNSNAYKGDSALSTPTIQAFVNSEKKATATPFTGGWGNLEAIFAGVTNKIAGEIATKSYKPGDISQLMKTANTQVQSSLQQ